MESEASNSTVSNETFNLVRFINRCKQKLADVALNTYL